jgi:hypothetical protein
VQFYTSGGIFLRPEDERENLSTLGHLNMLGPSAPTHVTGSLVGVRATRSGMNREACVFLNSLQIALVRM